MKVLDKPLDASPRCARRFLFLWAVVSAIGAPVTHPLLHAQEPKSGSPISQELLDALQRRGDLTLRNATLSGALFTIGELWKINLVVGENVDGQVNGVFKKAPLHEILDAILLSNGFSYRPVGDSLVVMPLDAMGQFNPFFRSATIAVENGNVQEIAESAKLFSSPRGEVRAIGSANSVFVLDFPDRVAMMQEFVTRIDAHSKPTTDAANGRIEGEPTAVAHFAPEFIDPVSAKEAIEAVLSEDGKIAIVELERKIVVVDYPTQLAQARTVLEQLDVPRPQVRIYALVYDLSLQDVEELGFNWDHAVKGRYNSAGEPQSVFSLENIAQVPFDAGTTGGTMTFANLSRNFDISAVLMLLQTANDARLLADPNVTVQDNHEATFESITEIPYQQLTQTSAGGQIGTTSFREAGIKLRVKPKISPDGTVLMHIEPEFSRLAGFTPEDDQPIIDTRRAITDVRVANRQTLVIGGLRQRTDNGNFNGVPWLKDVRGLGHLFRARDTDVRESELIVFIMPEIIGYDDPPKPRQMAAAETGLCKLNQVPVAEGCCPKDACTDRAECGSDCAVSPAENGPIEFGPSFDPLAPGVGGEEGIAPGRGDRASSRQPDRRLVRLPPLQQRSPGMHGQAGSPSVVPIPDPPANRMRTAFDNRYRDGNRGDRPRHDPDEPALNRRNDPQPKDDKKRWWQRALRF